MKPRSRIPATASLDRYLSEIGAEPLLAREEEAELARRIRAGDRAALDRLVAANLRFVVSIAKRYRNRGVSLADLVNEGNVGLIRAAERFDESKGVRFVSYAVWWIRQAILQAIAQQSHIVRVPASRAATSNQVARSSRQLRQEFGREPTAEELAAELQLSIKEVREALATRQAYVSLDAPVQGSEDASLAEFIPDDDGPEADDRTEREALRDALDSSLTALPEREQFVLRLYFGLDDGEPRTLEEIGRELGVTRERVRQLKERALSRLRHGARGRYLEGFVE
jgi:RNA polymerase primary sigma factor